MAKLTMKSHKPDVLIEVSHDACGTFDFYKAEEMVEMGREAARESLDRHEKK
jgi:NTE family protein